MNADWINLRKGGKWWCKREMTEVLDYYPWANEREEVRGPKTGANLIHNTMRQCGPLDPQLTYLSRWGWSSWKFFSDCFHFFFFSMKKEDKLWADNEDRKIRCKCEEKGENKMGVKEKIDQENVLWSMGPWRILFV